MIETISAEQLKARIDGNGELALIDVREEGQFGARHILLCANIPLGALELRVADRVPRKSAPVVLCDDGGGLAARAAVRMIAFGYSDVAVLDGGVAAWGEAGFEIFSGLNVPSKAFGEFVEHAYGTPSVSADELKAMIEGAEDMVVLDSRPMDEFQLMNVPTGVDCPGAELVWRVQEIAPDPATTVVVNCAGRTRSIIGAQSLINAGVPNRVVALRNGTMGWHLAGHQLEHGQNRPPPEVSAEGGRVALARAEAAATRFGVKRIDANALERFRAEADSRTLSILDVRTGGEFEAGHIADSRHAPGGQLVQATDAYVAVQGARVVLVDDKLARALMTASWLEQLGWCEVYVLETGLTGQAMAEGPRPASIVGLNRRAAPLLSPDEAQAAGEAGATLIDLRPSLDYRAGHIAGAWFAIRSRLTQDLAARGISGRLILTAGDETVALLAASDLASDTASAFEVAVLAGGVAAWEAAGLAMEGGMTNLLSPNEDLYLKAYQHSNPAEVEEAMQTYLDWEVALVEQIARPGGIAFRTYPA